MSSARARLWAALIVAAALAVLALNAGRPFHMDDALYVRWAREITQHWLDPYAGEVNWHGVSEPMVSAIRNPPLWGWILALVGVAAGWSERALHLVELVSAGVFLVSSYLLARRWSERPIVALALVAGAPVFLLSSATVMADVPMAAAWTCAVLAWCRPPSARASMLAALAATLAASMKWYALALVPLLFAWEWMVEKRLTRRSAWLLAPVAATLALDLWMRGAHGVSLFAHATAVATTGEALDVGVSLRAWIGLGFLGGACAGALLLVPLLALVHSRIVATAAALALLAVVLVHGQLGSWPHLAQIPSADGWLIAIQIGLWGLVGAVLLGVSMRAAWNGGPEARLAGLWIAGTFAFAVFLNWAILVRSFLPALPAVAIVVANALDKSPFLKQPLGRAVLVFGLVCGGLLGLELLRADTECASEARDAATTLATKRGTAKLWFQGHWGFQHYAEEAGAAPVDRERPAVRAGDIVLVPMLNTNIFGVSLASTRTLDHRSVPLRARIVVLGPRSGAGFWAHTLGPLPFAWNLGDVAETWVFEQK